MIPPCALGGRMQGHLPPCRGRSAPVALRLVAPRCWWEQLSWQGFAERPGRTDRARLHRGKHTLCKGLWPIVVGQVVLAGSRLDE